MSFGKRSRQEKFGFVFSYREKLNYLICFYVGRVYAVGNNIIKKYGKVLAIIKII